MRGLRSGRCKSRRRLIRALEYSQDQNVQSSEMSLEKRDLIRFKKGENGTADLSPHRFV